MLTSQKIDVAAMNVQNFGMDSPAKEIYEHKKTKNEKNEKNFNKKCLASAVEIMKEFANSSAATSAYDLIGGKQWWCFLTSILWEQGYTKFSQRKNLRWEWVEKKHWNNG